MKVVVWGTYDIGKPRVRILIRGLKENGVEVTECHRAVWGGIEDKSQIKGIWKKLRYLFAWFLSYPALIYQYLRLPRHDIVLVSYLGHLDILVLWPFAKIKRVPIVWDAFLSMYDTIVDDRKLISASNPIAKLIYFWEWLACRCANKIILDTQSHADYFKKKFLLDNEKMGFVFVGAEPEVFQSIGALVPQKKLNQSTVTRVLFYGQYIPLHGIPTIIKAARLLENESIEWVLIGKGQEQSRIEEMLQNHPLANVNLIPWVEYSDLISHIHQADICLGIFGDSDKAGRVIPNKVFQILLAGKTLITRDSTAIRELIPEHFAGVTLVEPASASGLANAVKDIVTNNKNKDLDPLVSKIYELITPGGIGVRLIEYLKRLL